MVPIFNLISPCRYGHAGDWIGSICEHAGLYVLATTEPVLNQIRERK